MTKIESWGAQYAMLLRRRAEQCEELARTEAQLTQLRNAILDAEPGDLYAGTGELTQVGNERPTATLTPPWLSRERAAVPHYDRPRNDSRYPS